MVQQWVLPLKQVQQHDISQVGGKNAALGEMINHLTQSGVLVPDGYAITVNAYEHFLRHNQLHHTITTCLQASAISDLASLERSAQHIQQQILSAIIPEDLIQAIAEAYAVMGADCSVAIRSSATAEDLPDASFAGQQETYLNVCGLTSVLDAVKAVYASLFSVRAIHYRLERGFSCLSVGISVAMQRMIRSDLAASGVLFTIDTETGHPGVMLISGSWGLGELLVQGQVEPDEFYLWKANIGTNRPALLHRRLGHKHQAMRFSTTSPVSFKHTVEVYAVPSAKQHQFVLQPEELEQLGRYALMIEKHYGHPMDIEWAKDGINGQLYIVQARPETVQSRVPAQVQKARLPHKSTVLIEGRAIGQKIGQGSVCLLATPEERHLFIPGSVLVTDMTDPDWEPIMKQAAAIITNRGGRTCHAAIIAREIGIPAIVGCHYATDVFQNGQQVTASCAEGDTGFVYEGLLPIDYDTTDTDKYDKDLPISLMVNVGNPTCALAVSQLPQDGVGLARLEFIISQSIGIHPLACLYPEKLHVEQQRNLSLRIAAYQTDAVDYFITRLSEGIALIAAAFYPKPVIVRLSDFKSNEYAHLLGGEWFEPKEENPMLGYRGASRYIHPDFCQAFVLECLAIKKVREQFGLTNVVLMVPFVRSLSEAEIVLEILAKQGLRRGEEGLSIYMMCELPVNCLQADAFLELFDGFSIGSNDLTQLTLGLDRDSALVAGAFDERTPAVKQLLSMAIQAAKRKGKYIGICGQGPSDYPDFADWLVEQGIQSLSLNPDSLHMTRDRLMTAAHLIA